MPSGVPTYQRIDSQGRVTNSFIGNLQLDSIGTQDPFIDIEDSRGLIWKDGTLSEVARINGYQRTGSPFPTHNLLLSAGRIPSSTKPGFAGINLRGDKLNKSQIDLYVGGQKTHKLLDQDGTSDFVKQVEHGASPQRSNMVTYTVHKPWARKPGFQFQQSLWPSGYVTLNGAIWSGGTTYAFNTASSILTILPLELQPASQMVFSALHIDGNNTASLAAVRLDTDGEMRIVGGVGNNNGVCDALQLDGLLWKVAAKPVPPSEPVPIDAT